MFEVESDIPIPRSRGSGTAQNIHGMPHEGGRQLLCAGPDGRTANAISVIQLRPPTNGAW